MNIQILHSHLKELLKTTAKPEKIAECLALCGPAVEYVKPFKKDFVYDIEVTTNRVDTASVMGIAREASAILPQFGIKSEFVPLQLTKLTAPKKSLPLTIKVDKKLTNRVMAIVMEVSVEESPQWIKDRLEASGIRSLNNLIDITNYVMLEVGHPTHVFDYDKITTHKLSFRLSKKGEKITTLDSKEYELPGGDIVIDDTTGVIIDLPGIMGTKNSVVDESTKRIIFFIDNNDALLMRRTSLSLGIRTMAVQLNEKNVDPELGTLALIRGVVLYKKLAKATLSSKVHDYYLKPYTPNTIKITHDEINAKIGIVIEKPVIKRILEDLGFKVSLTGSTFSIAVPSYRAEDVQIPEDIIEEVARIYGYHNLPSEIMSGTIPLPIAPHSFQFENKVKQTIKGLGGIEVYTLSLVPKSFVGSEALRLKNPLGPETEYLRTSLIPSLTEAAQNNRREDKFHLFEISHVYLPSPTDLPKESLRLGGVFKGHTYKEAKGILESLFESLHIHTEFKMEGSSIEITSHEALIGYIERSLGSTFVYEFSVEALMSNHKEYNAYQAPSKYPAQVEDITFILPKGVFIGNLIKLMQKQTYVSLVELIDEYQDAFTFRVWYHHPRKTLTDAEVTKLREKVINEVGKKFGGRVKS
jgi:phenylalanyl-tRNA synthetase beta chain